MIRTYPRIRIVSFFRGSGDSLQGVLGRGGSQQENRRTLVTMGLLFNQLFKAIQLIFAGDLNKVHSGYQVSKIHFENTLSF